LSGFFGLFGLFSFFGLFGLFSFFGFNGILILWIGSESPWVTGNESHSAGLELSQLR
jgi:hypothetical protein